MRIIESREMNYLSTSAAVAASVSSVLSFLQAHGGFAQTEIQTTSAEVISHWNVQVRYANRAALFVL